MRIGIVSDSHGKDGRLSQAVSLLLDCRVDTIVHCGDVGSRSCVKLLGQAPVPAYLVAGNMDHNVQALARAAAECGVLFSSEVIGVRLAEDVYLVATHGHDVNVLGELILDGQFPYVCHGHTHRPRDDRFGRTRVINPGALHGTAIYTVAVLDTGTDSLEVISLDDAERRRRAVASAAGARAK